MRSEHGIDGERVGLIVVDHGSRRSVSNLVHEDLVRAWRPGGAYVAVEPAHMELAEPSIESAFDACVDAGATIVVVAPYFLGPGRHWERDIPELAATVAARHAGVRHLVTAPLGPDPRLLDLLEARADVCREHATGARAACTLCEGTDHCRLR